MLCDRGPELEKYVEIFFQEQTTGVVDSSCSKSCSKDLVSSLMSCFTRCL